MTPAARPTPDAPPTRTAGSRKESLQEVLRRRSAPQPGAGDGRGAGARLSLEALTRAAEGTYQDVPLDALQPNPFQPRFQFHRQPLEELARSLAQEGQLEPAIARRVRREGVERLEIVAGARRLAAARICNATIRPFPTLRVDVRELTDEEAERISLIENLQRENLTPLEEGYRYWQLQQRDPRRWSVRAIAEFVHKKKSSVQNRLGLVKDAAVAEAVLREELPPTAGFHILRLPAPEREGYLRAAIAQKRTVEQIKADVERRLAPRRPVQEISLYHDPATGDAPTAPPATLPAPGAPGAPSGAHPGTRDGGPDGPDVIVRTHVRRRPGTGAGTGTVTDPALLRRREALEGERAELLTQIETLETELRRCQGALRGVERELAALGGPLPLPLPLPQRVQRLDGNGASEVSGA
ncbi:MAG TPA: ParB/RepB/Spo0J family partition protein [Chloroflexota bacterium]|nr:ParB/RepB/Spo0J family partition protein [Chloroflexota bacterium]